MKKGLLYSFFIFFSSFNVSLAQFSGITGIGNGINYTSYGTITSNLDVIRPYGTGTTSIVVYEDFWNSNFNGSVNLTSSILYYKTNSATFGTADDNTWLTLSGTNTDVGTNDRATFTFDLTSLTALVGTDVMFYIKAVGGGRTGYAYSGQSGWNTSAPTLQSQTYKIRFNSANTYNTPLIDGLTYDWQSSSNVCSRSSASGSRTLDVMWDATNVYFKINNGFSASSGDRIHFGFDINPGQSGNANGTKAGFSGSSFPENYRPDIILRATGTGSNTWTVDRGVANGSNGWTFSGGLGNPGGGMTIAAGSNTTDLEVSIARSSIGTFSDLGAFVWLSNSSDITYDAFPNGASAANGQQPIQLYFASLNSGINPSSSTVFNGQYNHSSNFELFGIVNYKDLTVSLTGNSTLSSNLGADLTVTGNLTIDASATLSLGGTQPRNISVAGNFSNSGTFNPSGKNVVLNGTSQTFGGSGTTQIYNLDVNSSSTTTLSGDITFTTVSTNGGTVNINGDVITGTNRFISHSQAGSNTTVNINKTLKTSNTNGLTGGASTCFTTSKIAVALGSSSIVEYNGTTQTVTPNTYKGLVVSGGGTKTMNGDVAITGNLTTTSGKLSISGNTLTLNGTVSGMSGSNSLVGSTSSKLTVTSTTSVGTVYFDQTTSADASTTSGTNALQNLVVSGSGGSITLGNKLNLFERLSVSAGTLNTGDLLVLRSVSGSGSNNTAYVDQVGGTISGQVTVERYVHNQTQGWRAITAPVSYNGISQGYVSGNWQSNFGYSANYGTRITGPSATNGIDDVTISASLMTYNSTTGAWNKISNTTTETIAGTNGNADNKSFFLFVRGDRTVTPNGYNPNAFVATTLAAKGKLQTGTQTFTYGGAANKAWLVGNPYACTVDMSTATFNGSIPNFVYVWDPNRPSSYSGVTGAYVTFDRTSWGAPTAGSTTKYFQSGQCFFVVPTSASGVNIVFNESNKNTGNQNNQTSGTGNGLLDEFNIKLSYIKTDGSKAEIDGIRAKFGSNFSTAVDADDAYKWSSADIENMSLVRNNTNLVIEARPHITSTDSLFLNITNLSIGSNYEFKLNPINFDASVSSCKLVDKFLNTETPINLTSTTLVGFNVTSVTGSNAANRFYVVFNAAGSLPTSNSLTVKAYKQSNNNIKIDWEAIAENNVKTYTVEKSTDANSFSKLSEATAKNGNTTNAYSIVDNNPVVGVNYYRIQSTQTNNNKAYSAIVRVEMSDKGVKSITVYPNPVKSSTNTIGLQMNNLTAGSYTAVLYNTVGQQVWLNTINHNGSNGSTSLQLNKTLASGTYQLQLTDTKGNSYKQTVLVVE